MAIAAIGSVAAAADPDLSGEWHLDTVSGTGRLQTTPDSSGNGNDGAVYNATQGPGKFGPALGFSGQNSGVVVPASASLEPATVTALAWVNRTGSPGGYKYILGKGGTDCSAASYALYTGGGGGLQFYVFDGMQGHFSVEVPASAVWDGNWHGVAGVYDGSAVHLYVDGQEVGSGTTFSGSIAYGLTQGGLTIGNFANAGSCTSSNFAYNGSIDEARVYHRALNSTELNYLLTASGPTPPELPAPVSSSPPVNTGPPAVTGSPVEGEAMFCSDGSWNGARPMSFSYQWFRDGQPIAGAIGSAYTITAGDVSHSLACEVRATNAAGSASAMSQPVYLTPTPPRNVVAPDVTGGTQVGQVLYCSTGHWTGSPSSYAYQWIRGTTPIAGATGTGYRTRDDDAFQGIVCQVSATNARGTGYGYSYPVIAQPTPIGAKYFYLGGRHGFLGAPVGAERHFPRSDGRYRRFAGGTIYWSPRTGAHEVHGAILRKYGSFGGPGGILGFPSTDELVVKGDGRYNAFEHSAIFWSPPTGAHEVHGAILDAWYKLGAVYGVTGFPKSDELNTSDHRGKHSEFQFASIYWTPRTGAHEIHGEIRRAWESSHLDYGYPVTNEVSTHYRERGAYTDFEHGMIYWSSYFGIDASSSCPIWACKDGRAQTNCNPARVYDQLHFAPDDRLSPFERVTGEIGTILKRAHFGAKGWASQACFVHNATGTLVRSPQWSTDGIWTLDLRLEDFAIAGSSSLRGPGHSLRLEVEPKTGHTSGWAAAVVSRYGPHGRKLGCPAGVCGIWPKVLLDDSNVPAGTRVHFGGLIVLDSDHGFLEVHPDHELWIDY